MSFASQASRLWHLVCDEPVADPGPHPSYGNCDRWGPEGRCSECTRWFIDDDGHLISLDGVIPRNELGNRL